MKAVLFDLGHTLINYHNDWKEPERRAVASTAAMVSATAGADQNKIEAYLTSLLAEGRERKLKELVEIPLEDVLATCFYRFGCEGDDDLMGKSLEAFYGVLLERRSLVPGTREMLESVKAKGYSIGMVSDVAWGLPSYFPTRDLKHFGLYDYFDDLVFSTDVLLRKPNPKIFKVALANLDASPKEAIFVGNNLQCDIKGALGVGMKAVLRRSDFYTHDEVIQPSYKIENWPEFEAILDSDSDPPL
jgi:HAD superfamily hydrolase (TIGR01509 family)